MCLHTDLENDTKIEPFGFAYRFTIQDCDEVLKGKGGRIIGETEKCENQIDV